MVDDAERAPRRRFGRPLTASLVGTLLLALVLEGLASALLAWRDTATPALAEVAHGVHDPELGWSHRPSFEAPDLYGPGLGLTTNARGFRGREEIDVAVPAGRYRVVCLGDSFTLGYGVGDASTLPAKLEALEPRIQAVNMGQGGYGIDQCYLWYLRDGLELDSDLLLFTFIAPDFDRMAEARFDGYAKPRLALENGALVLPTEPIPDTWNDASQGGARFVEGLALSRALRRWRRSSEDYRRPAREAPAPALPELTRLVLADLARRSRDKGQDLALVLVPLRDRHAGAPGRLAAWLRTTAGELGVPFHDLSEVFDALPAGEAQTLYLPDGHLNPHGNALVARSLIERLAQDFPRFPR